MTSRPTCKKCGAKILKARGDYRWSRGKVPKHCWRCGEKISNEELQQLQNFESFQSGLFLIIATVLFMIIIVVYSISS
jgi:DNA-directed RNA polymerase subunit RPC12/RpoP